MKQFFTLLSIVLLLGCSKTSDKPAQPTPPVSIFTNANATFTDYSYGMTCSGANCYMHVDVILSNLSNISKVELIYQLNVVGSKTAPVNGSNRLYHFQRHTIGVTKLPYSLRFTRTDNTTFDTPDFTIPK